jgi:hypothetical protein
MGLFKKKVNVEEEAWKEGIKKEALGEARTKAAPILKEKIVKDEVDRLTGDKKGKFFEKLGKEFKPLGDMATNEKMDRLLGHRGGQSQRESSGMLSQDKISQLLGHDKPTIQVIQVKGRNFRDEMGYDEIKADDRVQRILGDTQIVKERKLKEAADYDGDDFNNRVRRALKKK